MTDTLKFDSLSETASIQHTIVFNPLFLWLMRAAWTIIMLLSVLVAVLAIPERYQLLREYSDADIATFANMGIPIEFPAIYFTAMQALAVIASILVAAFLYIRRSNSWFLCFYSLALVAAGVSSGELLTDLVFYKPDWVWLAATLFYFYMIFYSLIWWIVPDGHFYPLWSKRLFFIAPIWWLLIFPGYVGFGLDRSILDLIIGIVITSIVVIAPIGLFTVYRRFHQTDPVVHQQVKWIVFGSAIWVVTFVFRMFVVVSSIGNQIGLSAEIQQWLIIIFYPLTNWGTILMVLALAFAVSRYRLYDIDVAINRSLVIFGVLSILAVVFVASAVFIQTLLGAENVLMAWLVSIAIPALLFNPVQKRVRHFIDRRIYGLRFDMNEARAIQRERSITNPGQHTGKTLGGYEVLDVLGRGGMGEVYKGLANGQTVAIKVLSMGAIHNADLLTRFIREGQTGMALEHRNIAKVYAVGEEEGVHYLIMEYIEGQDLAECLKQNGQLDIESSLQIMQDICTGLEAAHQAGFVHRDIKPGNVMLRENGEAVLMDFGVTKSLDSHTSLTGTKMVGTPHYMAPEQIKSDKQLDHRADIYSLGVMLYEMLSGERPFSGDMIQVVFAHMNQPAPDIRDINENIPREVAKAIQKAMAKSPDERFSTVTEFVAALK